MKSLDFNTTKYFECGGKKFFVRESLSFTRYKELQKLMIEFGYSATFQDIFNNLKTAIDAFNKHKYDEMVVTIHNVLNGITKIETKDDPALRLCALFIDEEGEDPTRYNEAEMKAKIDCWGEEYEVGPFFYLAAGLAQGWMQAYEIVLKNGSKVEPEKQPSDQ